MPTTPIVTSAKRVGFSAAFAIPVATLLLYTYSYSYEVGVAYAYGYSPSLIQITVDLVVNAGSGLFLYSLFLVYFLQLNLQTWPSTNRHVVNFIGLVAFAFLAFVGFRIWASQYLAAAFIASPVIAFLGQALMNKHKGTSQNSAQKPPMIYDARSNVDEDSLAHRIVSSLGFDPLLVFVATFLLAPALMIAAGYGEGETNDDFLLFEEKDENYALLRTYGGVAIAAQWDAEGCSTAEIYIVRRVVDLPPMRKAEACTQDDTGDDA